MALTSRKRAFIAALREGASNRDAAVAAGYSEKTASAAGSRLVKDKDVAAELLKLRALGLMPADVKADVKARVKPEQAPKPSTQAESAPEPPTPKDEPVDREPAGFDLMQALLHRDPKDFLLSVMNDLESEPKLRVDAAKALMPFVHPRKGESGKKDQAQAKAEQAASGKFGARRGPLRSVK
ncbi:terminase small subunit [Pseudomonas mosselii]|jgi:phage terminase small subunit|uniref:terminase small subunit n=1 Tax=Pseudomonas mosselii TaxID=78327 RepID=UPI0018D5BE22|nr:terminase small subunit [Pseudomonas mosselii]MBH3308968.1 terminase small subunit [Pseudomonas mosselii]MBH3323993.1 terminase small subunit [Pseudomonas mosselii]